MPWEPAGKYRRPMYGLTDHFNLFAQVGYNYMFGKEQTAMGFTYKNPDYSLLPLMAGVKYYFGDLLIGVGYRISIFEGETDGRFIYSPQVGYRVGDIDFSLHYTGFAKNDLQSMSSANNKPGRKRMGWKIRRKTQPMGVYVYQITIRYKKQTSEKYTGNVTLIR